MISSVSLLPGVQLSVTLLALAMIEFYPWTRVATEPLFLARGGGILREQWPSFVNVFVGRKKRRRENKTNGPKQNDFSGVFQKYVCKICFGRGSFRFFLSRPTKDKMANERCKAALSRLVTRPRLEYPTSFLRSILIYRFLSQIVDSLLRESRHADIPDTVLLPEGIPPSCRHRENVHTVSGSPNLFQTTRLIGHIFLHQFDTEAVLIINDSKKKKKLRSNEVARKFVPVHIELNKLYETRRESNKCGRNVRLITLARNLVKLVKFWPVANVTHFQVKPKIHPPPPKIITTIEKFDSISRSISNHLGD